MKFKIQKGFTLIEVSIVLLIVSILLGYTVAMFSVQQELGQYRKVEKDMNQILDSIVGFAQVNGRVPCPDSGAFNGIEDTTDLYDIPNGVVATNIDGIVDSCTNYVGRIPTATLGINGRTNDTNNLIDPWGNPYRYHVSSVSTDGNVVDIIAANGVKNGGLSLIVAPNLFICDDSTDNDINAVTGVATGSGVDANCGGVTGNPVVDNVSIVIVSMGKDGASSTSIIQTENTDGDNVYISTEFNDTETGKFDDKVKWISPNVLYSKMIEAGKLP